MTWVYTRRGGVGWLKPQGVPAEKTSDYDHDAVGAEALADLLGGAVCDSVHLRASALAPASPLADMHEPPPTMPSPPAAQATFRQGEMEFADSVVQVEPTFGTDDIDLESEFDSLEVDDVDLEVIADQVQPQQHFDFDVPDVVAEVEQPADLVPEVTTELRAKQLAEQFLIAIGELSRRNVRSLVEIILSRRWSSAQTRVRELLDSGYSVRQVHAAFQVLETWRQSDVMDERFGEPRRANWMNDCNPSLSWWEALELSEFLGDDHTLETVMAFLEGERHVWRNSPSLIESFGRFKHYLVRYRIRSEFRHEELACWTRTLDPRDGRCFGGAGNPEFTQDWWDGEWTDRWSASAIASRLFVGQSLEDAVLERMGTSDWWE